jgi:hypothetical protein
MFNSKLTTLGTKIKASAKNNLANAFVNAGLKKSAETVSGNGAKKYSNSGNAFVDQFSFLGSYKQPRTFEEIEKDCELLWAEDQRKAVMFIHYIRLITRKVQLFNGYTTKETQKGSQLKHEGIMRMIWLHNKSPKTFWKNIGLFVSAGSWQDIIKMLQYDLIYHGWDKKVLDWKRFGGLMLSGLQNENTSELVKKYLPQIRSNSALKTIEAEADNAIAKWVCSLVFGDKEKGGSTYKKYRKLKTSGTAHEWQKLISQGKHNLIDFNNIHGRALNLLVRSSYLKNQGLEDKYNTWVTKPTTEVKYTGYVHELFTKLPGSLSTLGKAETETINKQFDTLVTKAGESERTNLIVVRDISNSMSACATGTSMRCFDVAKAIALYFSEFLKGPFQDSYIEFRSTAKMCQWKGESALEKWYNDQSRFNGSTNFQNVFDLICNIKSQGVAESDFPTGILCISDGEFNQAQLGKTNVDAALAKLRNAGFSEEYVSNFVIVLWNLQSNYYGRTTGKKFETHGDVPNVFYFSGYEASTISFLNNKIKTATEVFDAAMNQEILNMIEI